MLPETVVPMEPVAASRPPRGEGIIHEVKWDGVRMLAFARGGKIRLQNRRLHDRTGAYPELDVLFNVLQEKEALLDGEVVVIREGKPSFPLTLRREQAAGTDRIEKIAAIYPVIYLVFDLLFWEGTDLRPMALARRREKLETIFPVHDNIRLVDQYQDGENLFTATGENRLEGIVSKEMDSPYISGKSRRWLKIKHRRKLSAVVGGYLTREGRPASLLLGLFQEDRLIYIGRAGSGLSGSQWQALLPLFREIKAEYPSFANPPRLKGSVWVKPYLPVAVAYQEWTPDMLLRAPVITGFPNCEPQECRLENM